ncbi:MAG: pyrrolo-quinoline quinone, partial [Limisphaerales bacterium]
LSPNTAYFFTAQATNATAAAWAVPSQSFTTIASNPVSTGVPVLTYHNDNTRQGLNANETALTLANVNTNTFGKLFAYSVDGFVYAQPLIMTNVPILGKGTHNVVFIATEHNSVYAFDADSNQGANATPLWQVSFINPAAGVTTVPNGDLGSTDITPEVGITATPVIDPATGTLYVEVKTKEVTGGVASYVHRLHALDITSGAERTNGIVANSPVIIDAINYPGTGQGGSDTDGSGHVLFNALKEHSRPALTLLNGKVFIAYASHGDNTPYHGWLFAYDAHTLTQTSVYNTTPYGGLGGFWDGGGGAAVDADGYLYLQTGNGTFDAVGATFSQASNNFAMAVLKFAATNGIQLVDYFAPSNAVSLSGSDQDLGASAPIVLPDSAGSAAHRHLLVGGGKTAPIYVMDRSNLGQFGCTTCPDNIVQQFNGGPGGDRDTTPAFFNNTLYI